MHAPQSSDEEPASVIDPTAIHQFHLCGLVCFDLAPDGIENLRKTAIFLRQVSALIWLQSTRIGIGL